MTRERNDWMKRANGMADKRDAWRAYAKHVERCGQCSCINGVVLCPTGGALRNAADASDSAASNEEQKPEDREDPFGTRERDNVCTARHPRTGRRCVFGAGHSVGYHYVDELRWEAP